MHELSICEEIREIVLSSARENGLATVTDVGVRIGVLSCVDPAALEFCFRSVMAGSIAAAAALHIETTAASADCGACGTSYSVSTRYEPCPVCGTLGNRITSGDELQVSRIAGDTGPPST